MTSTTVFKNPTANQIAELLQDPDGGGAVALLEDENGDWFAWRRENAPPHLVMSHDLEDTAGAMFTPRRLLNRHVALDVEDAMRIMHERSRYGPHG